MQNESRKINYLGFLSLLSLIAILGWTNKNASLYGFLGFLGYLPYFKVIPDELFLLNLRKACTSSFFSQLLSLIPFMFITHLLMPFKNPLPVAYALSFIVAILFFTIHLLILQFQEGKGL